MAVSDGDCIYKRVGLVLSGLSERAAYQRLKHTHTHTHTQEFSHEAGAFLSVFDSCSLW